MGGNIHRLKRTFTSGELSPLLSDRVTLDRYHAGCEVLRNMFSMSQGPATRRSGFEFIFDMTSLGLSTDKLRVRLIPFIYSELQAYVLVFFQHVSGHAYMAIADYATGILLYDDDPPTECPPGTPIENPIEPGDALIIDFGTEFDIRRFQYAQYSDELYITCSGKPPQVLKRYGHFCWTLEDVAFTEAPQDWSDEYGWPECVTFHQQRLVFAANILYPTKVWMSQAGDITNFGTHTPLQDSDAVSFRIASGTQNKIKWLSSAQKLLIGTMGDEWYVSGAAINEAITPTNIVAKRSTNYGSSSQKPLMVGFTTLYLDRHRSTVHEMVFDLNYDSYASHDLSVLAPHLTEINIITDWAYQQTPNRVVWCVRDDGTLIGLTYQREHKVVGWHRHETQGEFKAVTCIPGEGNEDRVWCLVHRVVAGRDRVYLERMSESFTHTDSIDGRFLDCWGLYEGSPTDRVSGLSYLEGRTVHILAEGAVHPPRVVVNGAVNLNGAYSHVLVGLGYESDLKPLLDDPSMQTGSAVGRIQRIINLDVYLYKSVGFTLILDNEECQQEEMKPFRKPYNPTDERVPLFSGIYHTDFPEGFARECSYTIRQTQPLPLTVLGVVDTFKAFE